MKSTCLILAFLVSLPAFASDFHCQGRDRDGKLLQVTYLNKELSFEVDEVRRDVTVYSETSNASSLRLLGVTKNILFAGGGRQTVELKLNFVSQNASMTIQTHTFYRRSEATYDLNCSL